MLIWSKARRIYGILRIDFSFCPLASPKTDSALRGYTEGPPLERGIPLQDVGQ